MKLMAGFSRTALEVIATDRRGDPLTEFNNSIILIGGAVGRREIKFV